MHPVGHRLQVTPVHVELFRQPLVFAHPVTFPSRDPSEARSDDTGYIISVIAPVATSAAA
jgi:hypothetical protein